MIQLAWKQDRMVVDFAIDYFLQALELWDALCSEEVGGGSF